MFNLVRVAFLLSLLAVLGLPVVCAAQPATPSYQLGPQDKLKVRVVDWRTGTYDTHEWPALTGEFTVGAAGTVSLPIVGELSVAGKTTAELAAYIAVSLRQRVGLAQEPYASVEVLQYRPFYIVGAVGKPGEYAYRPGLTVLQAIGLGGGLERTSEANRLSLEKEALATRGEIRVLETERLQNIVRQARLDTELHEKDVVHWPDELVSKGSRPELVLAMKEEEALLAAHRTAIGSQLKGIEQNKALLATELTSLEAKGAVLARQATLTRQELIVVSGLVARGLAGTPRQIALQQNEAQLENSRLDLELTTLRANRDIVRLGRDGAELSMKNRSQILAEKAELRSRLASLDGRISSLRELLVRSESRAPFLVSGMDRVKVVTTYTLTRETNGEIVRKSVSESEPIAPGDTLNVEQHREEVSSVATAAR